MRAPATVSLPPDRQHSLVLQRALIAGFELAPRYHASQLGQHRWWVHAPADDANDHARPVMRGHGRPRLRRSSEHSPAALSADVAKTRKCVHQRRFKRARGRSMQLEATCADDCVAFLDCSSSSISRPTDFAAPAASTHREHFPRTSQYHVRVSSKDHVIVFSAILTV